MPSRLLRRPRLLVLALVTLLVGAVLSTTSATAAPPYATTATIDTLGFTASEIESGHRAELEGTWSLPDEPSTPAGFVLDLPAELEGFADSFPLEAPDGSTMGTCTVTTTQLVCDIDSAFILANPRDLRGTFSFWAEATTQVTETTDVTYDFGSAFGSITIPVTPNTDVCTENCQSWEGLGAYKNSRQVDGTTIQWMTGPDTPKEGFRAGTVISATDVLGPDQTLRTTDAVYVYRSTTIGVNEAGNQGPIDWEAVPADQVSVTSGPQGTTVTFTADTDGSFYGIHVFSTITGGQAGQTYTNRIDYSVTGYGTSSAEGEIVRHGGGGTGIGDDVGRFAVTKTVGGTAQVPASTSYTIRYSVAQPDGTTVTGRGTVTAGGTYTSREFPRGSTVTLTETTPADTAAVQWAAPQFDKPTFDLVGGTETAVALTNTATLRTGTFEAQKRITGDADLVDPAITFALRYSYPAGDGFPAGSGTLTLPGDGTPVTSDPLPIGAVLTLDEAAPAAVPGATWGAPQLSHRTVTIGDPATAEVIVTNPIEADLGAFSVTKSLSGTGTAQVPAGTVFTVHYSYPAGDAYAAGSGELEVTAGATATVDRLPAGAVVTLDEVRAANPQGAAYGDPVFDRSTFTVVKGTTIAIDLDNPVDLTTGRFGVTKKVEGDGAAAVPADRDFLIEYSYPAGAGYEAGSGTLVVRADGTQHLSQELPYGAVVTLRETTPSQIDGTTWGTPRFSTDTVTIGDGTVVDVDLINTITRSEVPPAPPTPTTPPAPPSEPAPTPSPTNPSSATPVPSPATSAPGAAVHTGGATAGIAPLWWGAVLVLLGTAGLGAVAITRYRRR